MKHKLIISLIYIFTTIFFITLTTIYWSTLHPLLRFLMIDAAFVSAVYTVDIITMIIQEYQINKLWKDFCDENRRKDKEKTK